MSTKAMNYQVHVTKDETDPRFRRRKAVFETIENCLDYLTSRRNIGDLIFSVWDLETEIEVLPCGAWSIESLVNRQIAACGSATVYFGSGEFHLGEAIIREKLSSDLPTEDRDE